MKAAAQATLTQMAMPVISRTRMMVTPEQAEQWLKCNTHNRKLRTSVVYQYAADMRAGLWMYNPAEAIVFAPDMTLLNGQHRLTACFDSKVSIDIDVVFNAPKECQSVMDHPTVRQVSDFATLAGFKNATRVSALAKLVMVHRRHGISKMNNPFCHPTKTEMQSEVESNFDKLDAALVPHKLLCAPRIADFCSYVFREKDPAAAQKFMAEVMTGESIKKSDPAFTLRQRLIDNNNSKSKVESLYVMALFLKAWQYYRAGKPLHTLRWTGAEEFPEVAA